MKKAIDDNDKVEEEEKAMSEPRAGMDHVSHFVESLDNDEYDYLMSYCEKRNQHAKEQGLDTAKPDEGDNEAQQASQKNSGKSGEKEVSLKDFED